MNVDREKLSPMMQKYMETKDEYNDCILFYRLGDFYEMFFDDAKTASRELEIALTGKDCGLEERAPMCGVPHHSATMYIAKLIEKGYKVAICEQTEDPRLAKGLVKREVIRVVTPGTISEPELLDEKNNNYLCVAYGGISGYGTAFADVSTGEIFVTVVSGSLSDEIMRYEPKEILMNSTAMSKFSEEDDKRIKTAADELVDEFFECDNLLSVISDAFGRDNVEKTEIKNSREAQLAVFGVLRYCKMTQKSDAKVIHTLNYYNSNQYMDIDSGSRRNLEITETMRDKSKKGSILGVIDNTSTSMGARLLKQWIEKPLLNEDMINRRLYSVRELVDNIMLRDELSSQLSGIYDMARIHSRISMGNVTPKELLSMRSSLKKLPDIKRCLSALKSSLFKQIAEGFDILDDICFFLDTSISDDAPMLLRDGNVIKSGFNEELDRLRDGVNNGADRIAAIEAEERERTGIKALKIGFNKIFGYYIEIRKSNTNEIPADYVRKQTLANCERYITPRLKEEENFILGAGERILALESEIYRDVVEKLKGESERIRKVCEAIAVSDVLCSHAVTAFKNNYVMPEINTSGIIDIKDGRHPVVEDVQKKNLFVPNDTLLDENDNRMVIITGPNMAGKSTYMRQVAIITLLAQIGSFVPASRAKIGIVDKIFTRVGASDDIASGQSTFMVEMTEVAHILENATSKSLVILDEIGRGTSTFDGLSIAWSVVEYIQNKKLCGAKTLFATHYHELTQLEEKLEGVKNYNIAVKKRGDDITFLRKIVRGGADDSYGIEVAALAGVPQKVIKRAKEILKAVETDDSEVKYNGAVKEEPEELQVDITDGLCRSLTGELARIDATTLTPIEAMNKLFEICNKAKEIME